jgi:fibrillarin-like pre-rRNA processing protein
VFWVGNNLATENLVPGQSVYGERLVDNLRMWDPRRSKLCAALLKGMRVPLTEDQLILYLGVASGTTSSHVSDIVRKGTLFGVDFAPRSMRDFYFLCKKRSNMMPILGNANLPEEYAFVPKVDFIYQDVAQPNQAEILIKNSQFFLKSKGYALFMVKSRSIDVTQRPSDVYRGVTKKLLDAGFELLAQKDIGPFERDHLAILARF